MTRQQFNLLLKLTLRGCIFFALTLMIDRYLLPFLGINTGFVSINWLILTTLTGMLIGWFVHRPATEKK